MTKIHSSVRSSKDRVTDPWMLSLHHVRLARSMRDFSNQPNSISSSSSGMYHHHHHSHQHRLYNHGPSLVRSYSCRSPPATIRHNNENVFRQAIFLSMKCFHCYCYFLDNSQAWMSVLMLLDRDYKNERKHGLCLCFLQYQLEMVVKYIYIF